MAPVLTFIDSVKNKDPDRYRAALFADAGARGRLLTLYGFHAELAKIPEYVSEPMIGAIRYQWWREAIGEIYEGKPVRQHEVAAPLSAHIKTAAAPRAWIDALIDGRERDLDPRPFATIAAAIDYSAATSGQLMQIAARMAAPKLHLSAQQTDAILEAGTAWGLIGLARAFKYYQTGMLSGLEFTDITDAARDAHARARDGLGKIPAEIMPALAYGALVPKYLSKMSGGFKPLEAPVSYGPLAKQMRLMRAVLTARL
ncbi:MAG: squalene/phytoene synthase family protein [Robiginitomaculum sp.]